MSADRIALSAAFATGVVAILAACSSAPPPADDGSVDPGPGRGSSDTRAPAGGGSADGGAAASGEGGSSAGGGACGSNEATIDVSGFPKCLDGGRCVPGAAIPEADRKRLNTCPDGTSYCVPEMFLATGGNYLPKSCTSLAGGEGRCLSRLFKDIEAQKDALPQDVCAESERCAPCYDPITGALTGACNLVSCDAPKKPKVVFGDCCKDKTGKAGGRCVPKSLIPAKDQSGLEAKECNAQTELCAPSDELDPAYVPPKCKASALLGDYDGVCISDCVHKDFFTDLGTDQGNCAAGTFCAPCKNPLTGAATGAPGCAP